MRVQGEQVYTLYLALGVPIRTPIGVPTPRATRRTTPPLTTSLTMLCHAILTMTRPPPALREQASSSAERPVMFDYSTAHQLLALVNPAPIPTPTLTPTPTPHPNPHLHPHPNLSPTPTPTPHPTPTPTPSPTPCPTPSPAPNQVNSAGKLMIRRSSEPDANTNEETILGAQMPEGACVGCASQPNPKPLPEA